MLDDSFVFTIGGTSFSSRLASFALKKEMSYRQVITTLDDVEHPYPGRARDVLSVSFLPMTEAQATALYNALSGFTATVTYSDPTNTGTTKSASMYVNSDLEHTFLLKSIDGARRYSGGTVELREV